MEELRGAVRARTYLSGAALEDVAIIGEPCLIQDLSPRGASLVFREGFAIPRRFNLFIGQDEQAHRAVTIWQNGNVAGVKFLQARSNAPEVLPE